jgi:hypothetical protein
MHALEQHTPDTVRRPRRAVSHLRPRPTFFVRLDAGVQLPELDLVGLDLRRWIMRELGGWLQLKVLELIDAGEVEWSLDATSESVSGREAGVVITVRSVDRVGPRRPGLWAALSVAHALAELLGGVVVDPRRSEARFGPCVRLRPPADARVQVIDHLCVPSSRGLGRERWISSVGMAHFGLPDLEIVKVPPAVVELGARLLLGVAQHIIDASWSPPRSGDHPREALLTVGELHWALGGEAGSVPITSGRGWTRVALELDGGRAWPELLRLGPPIGARSWPDTGAWIRDAWTDLFGPPPAGEQRLRAVV